MAISQRNSTQQLFKGEIIRTIKKNYFHKTFWQYLIKLIIEVANYASVAV